MRFWRLVRTGSATPEPTTFTARAATFGAAVRQARAATLFVVNDEEQGLTHYVSTKSSEHIANNAANAVGGRVELVDEMPQLDTRHVVHMVANPDTAAARETQSGADPNQIAHYIAHNLEPGCWVAVAMRHPRKSELMHTRRWYDHRLGNSAMHHSRAGESVIASIWAGGNDYRTVESIANGVVASMPGFDVEVEARRPIGWLPMFALAVLGSVLSWFVINGTEPIAEFWPGLGLDRNLPLFISAGLFTLFVLSLSLTPRARAKRSLRKHRVPTPRHRAMAPSRPVKERQLPDGKIQMARDGDYPLARDSFLVGPSVVLGLVSPHTGEATDAAVTKMRTVPMALRSNIGPVVGINGGHFVHISQVDRFGGVASFGKPGSGKAQALSTPILTKNGWTTVGQLAVGDEVRHPSGGWTTVTALHPIERLPLFKVTTSDGQSGLFTKRHVWRVSTKSWRQGIVPQANMERARELEILAENHSDSAISTKDFAYLMGEVRRSAVPRFARRRGIEPLTRGWWPMGDMVHALADDWRHSSGTKRPRGAASPWRLVETHQLTSAMNIAVPEAFDMPHADLPLDPWLFGVWLGDGSSWHPHITVSCDDREWMMQQASATNKLSETEEGFRILDTVDTLRTLDVLNNKHIPSNYAMASVEQRLAVLQGLMDTDGTIDTQGNCELSLSDERLATDALELIRSLGIKASMTTGDRHRIHFTTTKPVFRMPRKAERLLTGIRKTQDRIYIRSVVPVDTDEQSRCISVSAPDGMYVVGDAMVTHNSIFVTNIFGYDVALRVRGRSGLPPLIAGDTGANNTLIAFENKGRDGVAVYQRFSQHFGDPLTVIEVADPSTPAIDMFPQHGTVQERAAFFVDSMVYAFGETAIGNRSQSTLNQVVSAALVTVPQDIEAANATLPQKMPLDISVLEIVDVLLCSRGEELGVALAGALTTRAAETQDPTLIDVVQRLGQLYGAKVTPSQRRSLCEAPASKVALLLKSSSWWARRRPRGTWDSIISTHQSVVVNAGQAVSGATIDSGLTKMLLAMLVYGLQKAIERNCAGWGESGKSVSLYSDELSLLAGVDNSDVFQWFRNQGRSFGVRPVFATQIPEQLEIKLRTTVTGFSTFLWLGQDDPGVAGVAVEDLSADGSEWAVSDITTLEPYHGVVRATVNKQRLPSVPVKTVFYGGDAIGRFIEEQGLE